MSVLAGIRVLELANFISAPYASQLLGDFGAEVIKIERPGQIDQSRAAGGLDPGDIDRSAYFAATLGRNKRSVCLDVAGSGHGAFIGLLRRSDILVENFKPGTLEKWNLGWPRLHELNPRLILVRISGYGQDGPMRDQPAVDRTTQAFVGMSHLTGEADGPPMPAGVTVVDHSAGLLAFTGALLALRDRDTSGLGQVVDVALYDALLPMLCEMPAQFGRDATVRSRSGDYYPGSPLMRMVQSSDGSWIQLAILSDDAFRRFAAAFESPQVAEDERFRTAAGKERNRDPLIDVIRSWTRVLPTAEVLRRCQIAGVPCSPVQDVGQLLEHPQVRARGDFVECPDPMFAGVPASAVIPRLSRTPGRIERPGPHLGQDQELIEP